MIDLRRLEKHDDRLNEKEDSSEATKLILIESNIKDMNQSTKK